MTTILLIGGGAILAFHVLKSAAKPLMAAGVIGAVSIAAWSFWPSRNTPAALVAKSQQPFQALKAGAEEEATKKQTTKKAAAKASPVIGRQVVQVPPSGNPSRGAMPLMVTPLTLPTPAVRNPTAELLRQKRQQMQDPLSFDARMRAKMDRFHETARQQQQRQKEAQAKKRQQQQQQAAQHQPQRQLAQKQPMRSGSDIMNDFKRTHDLHAQRRKAQGKGPPPPATLRSGPNPMAGRWMPQMQMPHMGGHGGGHR